MSHHICISSHKVQGHYTSRNWSRDLQRPTIQVPAGPWAALLPLTLFCLSFPSPFPFHPQRISSMTFLTCPTQATTIPQSCRAVQSVRAMAQQLHVARQKYRVLSLGWAQWCGMCLACLRSWLGSPAINKQIKQTTASSTLMQLPSQVSQAFLSALICKRDLRLETVVCLEVKSPFRRPGHLVKTQILIP